MAKRVTTPEQRAANAQRARERRAAEKAKKLEAEAAARAKAAELPPEQNPAEAPTPDAPPPPEAQAAPAEPPKPEWKPPPDPKDPWPPDEATDACESSARKGWEMVRAGVEGSRYERCMAVRPNGKDPVEGLVRPTAALMARHAVTLGPGKAFAFGVVAMFGPTFIEHMGELAVKGINAWRERRAGVQSRVAPAPPPPAPPPAPEEPPKPAAVTIVRNSGGAAA